MFMEQITLKSSMAEGCWCSTSNRIMRNYGEGIWYGSRMVKKCDYGDGRGSYDADGVVRRTNSVGYVSVDMS